MLTAQRSEFWKGIKAEMPLLIGVIPFGMIYGVLAVGAGIPAGASQAMSAIIFAGSAQFITTQLYTIGAPTLVIILTISVVNLRHMLYSASVAPYTQKLRWPWKWLLAYLLTDEAYAVTITHYQQVGKSIVGSSQAGDSSSNWSDPDNYHWFFLGAGFALWASWQVSTAAGIFLGAAIPASWSLDFTLALTFIAIVVPTLKDRPSVVAALVAGVVAVLAAGMPLKLGLVTAALVGILAGFWMENRS
jgi:predicted branched-subunit amino acid permease